MKNSIFPLKGNWNKPIILKMITLSLLNLVVVEGNIPVGLARRFPNQNFIGMDIKGARLWKGAKIAVDEKMANVAFIRNRIDFIETYFAPDEVSEIWIPFS